MPNKRITYGEHAWEIEYEMISVNGRPGLQLVKVNGPLEPLERMDQFLKALRPFWISLELPANTALVMHEDLIPFFAEAAPGSSKRQ